MYPWPIGDFDDAMDEALDIAMDYLERTGQELTSLGADNDGISRHRVYGCSRHRAALVEMVRVGCGRGDHGPSAQ